MIVCRLVRRGGGLGALIVGVALLLLSRAARADEVRSPSLLLTPEIVERIRTEATGNRNSERTVGVLLDQARKLLDQPTLVQRFNTEFHRQLSQMPLIGQESVQRLTVLPLAWHLTGDRRFADRARVELLGLAQLETWFPEHFLGLSRMALGVALGYDWLADHLDAEDRAIVRTALIERAIKPGLASFRDEFARPTDGWVQPRHRRAADNDLALGVPDGTGRADVTWPVATFNWNIACNTGLALAALAVMPEAKSVAEETLEFAIASVRNGFSAYAPSGAWPEGPMYWGLATRDAAVLIDALKGVLDHDYGLSETPSLAYTAAYFLHVTGPTNLMFNYGDSDTRTERTAMRWLAERYDQPVYAWFAGDPAGHALVALDLIWQPKHARDPGAAGEPTARWFGGYNLLMMRSRWGDPSALFAGFKAGNSRSHHDDLDLGTFVVDSQGVRWAIDLGKGNYDLPGYFAAERFQYYRTATIGQNTLVFEERNQADHARADIIRFGSSPGFTFAVADLSDAYDAPVESVLRGIAMIGGADLLIQDEISSSRPEQALWTMHTRAAIALDGAKAALRQDGKQLTAVILAPKGATFATRGADPCKTVFDAHCQQQNPNHGVSRLVIDIPAARHGESRRVSVALFPGTAALPDHLPGVISLFDWRVDRPVKLRDLGG